MKSKFCIVLAVLAVGVCSCRKNTPYVYRGWPKSYSSAWVENYGQCYDSVPYNVLALDLYEGLVMDSTHHTQGTGYNLYISDIFMEDTVLEAGTYHSLQGAEPEPYTFLRGKDYEGYPHGIYLLQIENNTITHIQVFDSGQFVLRDTTNGLTDLHFTLYYKNTYGYKATYTTTFQGELQPWSKK
ncbi:MAG: hypothetical protein IJS82_01115 [Paludibacteraceae bacterium]|nr:hypothetical protein [Paludibacteraceae bacterium]